MNSDALKDTWVYFQQEHSCSIDKMLCNPALRNEFLAAARLVADCDDEYQILWGWLGFGKRSCCQAC